MKEALQGDHETLRAKKFWFLMGHQDEINKNGVPFMKARYKLLASKVETERLSLHVEYYTVLGCDLIVEVYKEELQIRSRL